MSTANEPSFGAGCYGRRVANEREWHLILRGPILTSQLRFLNNESHLSISGRYCPRSLTRDLGGIGYTQPGSFTEGDEENEVSESGRRRCFALAKPITKE